VAKNKNLIGQVLPLIKKLRNTEKLSIYEFDIDRARVQTFPWVCPACAMCHVITKNFYPETG
jgi:hypothetical protein